MDRNRTGKYLKYAVGEIVLVVIGILIALSINNWNEKRKNTSTKIESLKVIQTNLSQEKKRLDFIISQKQITILKINQILTGDFKDIELENLYDILTEVHLHLIANTGYKILTQNNNINLIKNKELVKELISFYESYYTFLTGYGTFDENYAENLIAPYLLANIPTESNRFEIKTIITKELDKIHFRNLLINKIKLNESYIKTIQTQALIHIKKLEDLLKQELSE